MRPPHAIVTTTRKGMAPAAYSAAPFLLWLLVASSQQYSTILSRASSSSVVQAFTVLTPQHSRRASSATARIQKNRSAATGRWLSSPNSKNQEKQQEDEQAGAEEVFQRTSFDQAGASLIEEEDNKRMENMGDFDSNPNSDTDSMEKMRAAIRARTSDLGIEKSKVSAEYIRRKQQEAASAGSARAAAEQNSDMMFGGLDLSQIRTEAPPPTRGSNSFFADAEGDVPNIFYDPEEELTEEERLEADPVGAKSIPEQFLIELQGTKWPEPGYALRQLGLMILVVALTAVLIIEWDKVLREVITNVLHFIPSKEDMADYASRFDGLDLPAGWTDNVNEDGVASFTEQVGSLGRSSSSGMPDL